MQEVAELIGDKTEDRNWYAGPWGGSWLGGKLLEDLRSLYCIACEHHV